MPVLGDIDGQERRLRTATIALNKRKVAGVTLVEAVDEAELWRNAFEAQQPFLTGLSLGSLFDRAPLYLCAIASEIGFRFEGVGTEYWNKLASAFGVPITMGERARFGETFAAIARKYALSHPSESAFSTHFSIISWPIANALLPLDLLGPVTRMLARAPATALPGPGRPVNFPSLRAWASAAEGARLIDWLRFEAASERVLTALLTENRSGGIPAASYTRLHDALARSSEAFFATRAARQRSRRNKVVTAAQQSLGRLTLTRHATGPKLYASWPALPADLAEEARVLARAAGWRPQLWGAGVRLHSDTALGDGPFLLNHAHVPRPDQPAYAEAAATFGEGSDVAAALAGRTIDWNETLLFDPNPESSRGEQRFSPFDGASGAGWIASAAEFTALDRLRLVGKVAGYRLFEADLAAASDRAILAKEGLLAAHDRTLAARHPIDAITAPQGVVRPMRPFVLYRPGPPVSSDAPQRLQAGDRVGHTSGTAQVRLRCEPAAQPDLMPVSLSLLERDGAFSALTERRLQIRVESKHSLRDAPVTVELEIGGKLAVRCTAQVPELPATIDAGSPLLKALYADAVRTRLIESGAGTLRASIGRLAAIEVPLTRPVGVVDWSTDPPTLTQVEAAADLVCASAAAPHRFAAAGAVVQPARGAAGYALRFGDGRIADPVHLLASSQFNLGDFAAQFGDDLGSRQFRDGGRGSGELARARVAWSRAECNSLQALAAKSRIVRQFEAPLVHNLCGRDWAEREQADRPARSDPHEALYLVALEQGLASLPEGASERHAADFAQAFAEHARTLDADWPLGRTAPLDGAMDDALNLGFADAVSRIQTRGELPDADPDDCDFGSPEDAWAAAAEEALRRVRRTRLARLIAPSEGGRRLRDRFFAHVSIADMAEDLAAWTRTFALPRGQLSADAAAAALQLWLSPAACDGVDAAVRVLINDPFVARATRYAAIRMHSTVSGAVW
ncbi:hypothetical protein ACYZX9_19265 (plasmid) [Sphingomonas citri]|jgi:hypothetical protein